MEFKFVISLWAVFVMFLGTASAMTIYTETPVTDPPSTVGYWGYYYTGSTQNGGYVDDVTQYNGASAFLGYVTSDHGPWVNSNADSWGSGNYHDDAPRSVHVFQTYIVPSEDRTVYFQANGDDGYSIFIDDLFLVGGTYWDHGVVSSNFELEAGKMYKLAYVGSNSGWDEFAWNFTMFYADGTWSGRISEAPGITMDASPVPVPGAVWLLGSGLVTLVAARRRRA